MTTVSRAIRINPMQRSIQQGALPRKLSTKKQRSVSSTFDDLEVLNPDDGIGMPLVVSVVAASKRDAVIQIIFAAKGRQESAFRT